MKSSYIAVIAIAIVVIAGAGIYFALSNNGGLDADVVKDSVGVGDYAEFDMTLAGGSTEESVTTFGEFIELVFSLPDGAEEVGKETITYKGAAIECEKYMAEGPFGMTTYWVKDGAVYKTETNPDSGLTFKTTLDDTSLDLTTPKQEISKDSFVKSSFSIIVDTPETKLDMVRAYTHTITGYDPDTESYSETVDTKVTGTGFMKLTVVAVSGDELTTEGADDSITKERFYSLLDFEHFKEYLKECGTVAEGQKIDKGTVKTFNGDRKIIQQEFKITGEDGKVHTLTVKYGEKGALYAVTDPEVSEFVLLTIKSTSMFQKA